jgi:hypothetical protein
VVKSENLERQYRVVLADVHYDNLAQGKVSKEQLLKCCFEYFANNQLLDQLETKFVLRDIGKQFPKFEEDIKEAIVKDKS